MFVAPTRPLRFQFLKPRKMLQHFVLQHAIDTVEIVNRIIKVLTNETTVSSVSSSWIWKCATAHTINNERLLRSLRTWCCCGPCCVYHVEPQEDPREVVG